ncbi:hypothetical protein H9Q69_005505 [Fusarium xylarioides]|uniref:DUF4345 domain-containing protein n=1 Tax=Fusarium xylarioides TaxID=221167 RepID=A0A9P7I107_9HYPO|nr:hypothetical protein H9Q70_002119 [Fusarium xylarioides]KAG5765694.1 hypothetical protein H9Q72_006243 [Fusarium xylarioides]KAG5784653.1 hypothetical protein H9Q73_001717 [Fusarium xylarioides]KAG5795456.1 hypothetical protein H9Q69_005505 [Fusarium xylarioides]KAG5812797.1 hypothetical protein H9Q71_004148 [Fusarium xylarioides]
MSEYGSSQFLSRGLKIFAIFSMFAGTVDLITGHKFVIPESERALLPTPTLAFVDNQLRFLGAIWGGYGTILWWASNNLQARKVPLSLLGTTMFIAGIGRLTSGLSLGWTPSWLKIAAVAELIVPPLIYLFGF